MARARYLPKYVSSFTSKTKATRLRFRRKGFPAHYFKHALGTEEFRAEYRQCMTAVKPEAKSAYAPGTIGDLFARYVATPSRLGPSETTRAKVLRILERFVADHGDKTVLGIQFEHVDAILAKRVEKVQVGTRMEGGVEAARKLRKELIRMFDFAIKTRMRPDNPVKSSDKIRVPAGEKSPGYYAWKEADIAKYRARHALGTKQRLAMEILLWSGQRRGDAHLFGDNHIIDGRIEVKQKKGGKELGLLIVPQLRAAIEAMPQRAPESIAFLLTDWGKPYSSAGFGNWFRECCDDAGLPQCTAHGLRKAVMRRGAELELGNQSLKSMSGHTEDSEVALYTASASQRRLADSALTQISEWEVSHLSETRDISWAQDDEK